MTPAQIAHMTALADEHLRSHGYQQGGFTACTCELCDLARGVLSLLEERARLTAQLDAAERHVKLLRGDLP